MKRLIVGMIFTLLCFLILSGSNKDPLFITRQYDNEIFIKEKFIIVIHERENINNIILINKEFFIEEYINYFDGNKNIRIIMEEALKQNVPVNLAIALAFGESSLNERVYNQNERSIDRGLFQLNNKSYPFLTKDQFYDPIVNTKYGIAHLKEEFRKTGSYEVSLVNYNCGNINRINVGTFEHVVRILNKEKELNEMLVTLYEKFEWSKEFKNSYPS